MQANFLLFALGVLTWIGLLAVGTWTVKVIIERVTFHRLQCLAAPVHLTLCLARWKREFRISVTAGERLGWLRQLTLSAHTSREMMEQLYVFREQVRRCAIQLPTLGNQGSALGLFGTCLSLLQCGESADRIAVIVLGVGTTLAGVGIWGIALAFHNYFQSRFVELLPQIKETLDAVTELVLVEERRLALKQNVNGETVVARRTRRIANGQQTQRLD